jgi:hypothetical protein
MPLYEYRCSSCSVPYYRDLHSSLRDSPVGEPCDLCSGLLRRSYSFTFPTPFTPHYNQSIGRHVSSRRQFQDEVHRMNEYNTARTGIEHNARVVDFQDLAPAGDVDPAKLVHDSKKARGLLP